MSLRERGGNLMESLSKVDGMKKRLALRGVTAGVTLGILLLAAPGLLRAGQEASSQNVREAEEAQQAQDPSVQMSSQEKRDADQAARDKAQAKRDVQQAERDREQAKRDAEQHRVDEAQSQYDDAQSYLDEEKFDEAANRFARLAGTNGPKTDAALYWEAYAQNKQGKREAALATIADLKKRFPQSKWKKDGEALEIEVRQRSGATVNPDAQPDDDLKILALQGVMNNDPARGVPIVTRYLSGSATPKQKSKALFMLAQNGSPQAQEELKKIALGQTNPDLQRKAVEYLGMTGKGNAGLLAEVYNGSSDTEVKRAVIRSYMISGDHEHLLNLAKSEKDEELKREAIRNLGISGGQHELEELYPSENSVAAKKEILQALFLSGDGQKLGQLAEAEKNPELRRDAVRNLGLMGGRQPELQAIYARETDREIKEEVLQAYFLGGNANGLIAVARAEKDPELKKKAVEKLSLMGTKEANEYLIEILQK